MPIVSSPAASHLKSIHLLRHLLREATYLPDANAREWFHRQILKRFRAHQHEQRAAGRTPPPRSFARQSRYPRLDHDRTLVAQQTAQRSLNYLRRANNGELRCVERVLYMTYGRMGPRRYALLNGLLVPMDSNEGGLAAPASTLQELYHSRERCLSFFDAPVKHSPTQLSIKISPRYGALRAVLISQMSNAVGMKHPIRQTSFITPALNIWHRPMPIRRARNNVRRWYAETMSRLLPPLPHEEWRKLSDLASGDSAVSFKMRRTLARHIATADDDEKPLGEVVKNAIALRKPSPADKPAGLMRGHNITPKLMRRLYRKVFRLCCILDYDETRSRWRVTWGSAIKRPAQLWSLQPQAAYLFEGVDAHGHVQKKGHKPEQSRHSPGSVGAAPGDHRAKFLPSALHANNTVNESDKVLGPDGEQDNTSQPFLHIPFFVNHLPKGHPQRAGLAALEARKMKQRRLSGD